MVGGTQVSFKMKCWRHWRLVWAQMRSCRDPEGLLDDLLEVRRGSCSAGAWPGWQLGGPRLRAYAQWVVKWCIPGWYSTRQQTARQQNTRLVSRQASR